MPQNTLYDSWEWGRFSSLKLKNRTTKIESSEILNTKAPPTQQNIKLLTNNRLRSVKTSCNHVAYGTMLCCAPEV